jgi:integrase
VIIWRRHLDTCTSTDPNDARCGCPIYQEYRVNGKRFRRSLKTRNWQKAIADSRKKEMDGFVEKRTSPTIQQATDQYIADATARQLREPTIYKFKLLFRQLNEFAADTGLVYVSDLNLDNLRRFRQSWANKNESARVKLGNLKALLRFCHESKWILENPATKLQTGRVIPQSIVPITPEEFIKILSACDKQANKHSRLTSRALILLMYHTGLRIRDAVTLRSDAVRNGKLFLRTTKTGTDVFCPLPEQVLAALAPLPGKYFFWSGVSKPKSAVGDYQRVLRRVFKDAGTPRVYPHLFRHTCATNWLSVGMSIETAAVLLGHSSSKITAKHYSHWIKTRQDSLEAAVRNSWAQLGTLDPQMAQK